MATITNISTFLLTSVIYTKYYLKKQQQHRVYSISTNALENIRHGDNTSYKQNNKSPKKENDEQQQTLTFDKASKLREYHFSKNLSLSYKNSSPLMIIEGKGCRLLSSNNISYLDTRNNVAHCGHSHPYISSVISDQVHTLNTNTRYLHPNYITLAEKLSSTLPNGLDVVFFTNSGSEANDLAIRIAMCYNSNGNMIVVDGGYHGHTLGTLQVSPYKFEKSNEPFLKSNKKIAKVPAPNTFRITSNDIISKEKNNEDDLAKYYAKFVQDACTDKFQNNVTAMIIEGGMSVAGVILPPPMYLRYSLDAVRRAGGLYISDEVQTGFGRLGTCFWAFQYHQEDNIIPDIVTVGKPFGNGMPLAAVITTREIADRFVDVAGVEYFNTFGGNTVCTAAGLAVLQTIENEQLQSNALRVGTYLKTKLIHLQTTKWSNIIGDIRGSGLFLGIEFIISENDNKPATKETSFLCMILKEKYYILSSIDGFDDNVLVIKPPMCFSKEDVDEFVHALDLALEDLQMLEQNDLDLLLVTPT